MTKTTTTKFLMTKCPALETLNGKILHDMIPHDKIPHHLIPYDQFPHNKIHNEKIAKLRQSCDSYCMQKIANDNFCMHCCNWQLLFALLLLTIFVCMLFSVWSIAIDTFLYAMLYTLITFIYTIANNFPRWFQSYKNRNSLILSEGKNLKIVTLVSFIFDWRNV